MAETDEGSVELRLASVLEVDVNSRSRFFRRFSRVWGMADELEVAIEGSDLPRRYLEVVPEVRGYFSHLIGLAGGVVQPIAQPNATMLTILDLCSDELSSRSAESYPSVDALYALLAEIEGLIALVRESKVDPELATYVLEQLHRLAAGIDQFRYAGKAPAREAVTLILGDIQLRDHGFPETEENVGIVRQLSDFVNRYAGVMCLAATGTQIGQTVMLALQAGQHPH